MVTCYTAWVLEGPGSVFSFDVLHTHLSRYDVQVTRLTRFWWRRMNIETMFERPDVRQLVHAFLLLDGEGGRSRIPHRPLHPGAKSATLPSVLQGGTLP